MDSVQKMQVSPLTLDLDLDLDLCFFKEDSLWKKQKTIENEIPVENAEIGKKYNQSNVCCNRYKRLMNIFQRFWNAEDVIVDYSLLLFRSDSPLRTNLNRIFQSKTYDKVMLGFVIANCIVIAMENPTMSEQDYQILKYCNYAFNLFFLLEAIGKIIASGLLIGRKSYLRSPWNILDLFLVFVSVVDVALEFIDNDPESMKVIQILKVFRLLRCLRPLRMIGKAEGLKIVLETLILSVKPIGNLSKLIASP